MGLWHWAFICTYPFARKSVITVILFPIPWLKPSWWRFFCRPWPGKWSCIPEAAVCMKKSWLPSISVAVPLPVSLPGNWFGFWKTAVISPWSDEIEVTVEANPGTLNREKLQALRENGVNRLSLGASPLMPCCWKPWAGNIGQKISEKLFSGPGGGI